MGKFVITGASCAGKSTLIASLAAAGYATVPEVGRQIVAEQMRLNGTALPWMDQSAFMQMLFARSISAYDQAGEMVSRPVFFDRSFIEAIAYGAIIGRAAPEDMLRAAAKRRFETLVFVCPPWQEIFTRDSERTHDFEFAVRDHEANIAAYKAAGYDLVEVPRAPIKDRLAFIMHKLSK